MYVAVAGEREALGLFVPATLYSRSSATTVPADPSPFIRLIPSSLYEEWQEGFTGLLAKREAFSLPRPAAPARSQYGAPGIDPFSPESGMPAPAGFGATAGIKKTTGDQAPAASVTSPLKLGESGYCRHKVFGRGKIVQFLPPDKDRVNFPGMGLKVIMGAYLQMEE